MTPTEREAFLQLEADVEAGTREYQDLRNFRYTRGTLEKMNQSIIQNTNDVVGENDDLWILGDLHFGKVARLRSLRERIVCKNIHWIWGNHDKKYRRIVKSYERFYRKMAQDLASGHMTPKEAKSKLNRQAQVEYNKRILERLFATMDSEALITWEGQKLLFAHTARCVWDQSHRGVWHCYGHSHGNFEKKREELFPDLKMIDVGIDYRNQLGYGYSPWSFQELKKEMDKRKGQALDHHGKD
jgi:calcineurin-like phosphoesterase family protein